MPPRKLVVAALAALAIAVPAQPALATDWFPHPADANWVYIWSDTQYNATPTDEKVTVKEQKAGAFTLAWTTADLGNPEDAADGAGAVVFQDNPAGVLVVDWQATPPPAQFPIMCAQVTQCGNSLASVLFNLIWGNRTPLLSEPLLIGSTWSGVGGARNDVSSNSEVVGVEKVTVPAFPDGVEALKVKTEITQAGALGDPYGSGIRTVWWVYGVGAVKIVFAHAGGANAPMTTADLKSTSLTPKPIPTLVNYFPMEKGATATYRWTNKKHLPKPQVEKVTVDEVVNRSARFSVKHVSGPIKVAGAYGFSLSADGVTNLWSLTRAATPAKLPPLGPKAAPPTKRRHFFTPFDLMTFGFNPVLPAYPTPGTSWKAATSGRDWETYGVTGTATVVGVQRVTVPAGTFSAVVVQTTLAQAGFRFGSGTRTSWFAPGKGLVKLVFRHADHSVSTVELLK